jgi:hypothetical protein
VVLGPFKRCRDEWKQHYSDPAAQRREAAVAAAAAVLARAKAALAAVEAAGGVVDAALLRAVDAAEEAHRLADASCCRRFVRAVCASAREFLAGVLEIILTLKWAVFKPIAWVLRCCCSITARSEEALDSAVSFSVKAVSSLPDVFLNKSATNCASEKWPQFIQQEKLENRFFAYLDGAATTVQTVDCCRTMQDQLEALFDDLDADNSGTLSGNELFDGLYALHCSSVPVQHTEGQHEVTTSPQDHRTAAMCALLQIMRCAGHWDCHWDDQTASGDPSYRASPAHWFAGSVSTENEPEASWGEMSAAWNPTGDVLTYFEDLFQSPVTLSEYKEKLSPYKQKMQSNQPTKEKHVQGNQGPNIELEAAGFNAKHIKDAMLFLEKQPRASICESKLAALEELEVLRCMTIDRDIFVDAMSSLITGIWQQYSSRGSECLQHYQDKLLSSQHGLAFSIFETKKQAEKHVSFLGVRHDWYDSGCIDAGSDQVLIQSKLVQHSVDQQKDVLSNVVKSSLSGVETVTNLAGSVLSLPGVSEVTAGVKTGVSMLAGEVSKLIQLADSGKDDAQFRNLIWMYVRYR